MDYLEIMARNIETSNYLLRKVEIMKWAEEDLHETLRDMLTEGEFEPGIQVHAQVGFGAVFKDGPHYESVKHIRPDFLLTNRGRYPIAFIDYLSVCHDPAQDRLKAAVAEKAQIAFIQVPEKISRADLKVLLIAAGVFARIELAAKAA